MSSPEFNPHEPLEKLKTYPAFQNLRAKAETHQLQFRPKESLRLQNNGTLERVLDERTEQAWNVLNDCRKNGMNLNEAEEIALPNILLPSEQEEEQAELDQLECLEEKWGLGQMTAEQRVRLRGCAGSIRAHCGTRKSKSGVDRYNICYNILVDNCCTNNVAFQRC